MADLDELLEATGAFAIGVTLGAVILKLLDNKQCPVCRTFVKKGIAYCTNCHAPLAWV